MIAKDVWVANDEGSEIVRARDIASATLDYDGNVTVRLSGGDGTAVTIANSSLASSHRSGALTIAILTRS